MEAEDRTGVEFAFNTDSLMPRTEPIPLFWVLDTSHCSWSVDEQYHCVAGVQKEEHLVQGLVGQTAALSNSIHHWALTVSAQHG